MPWRGAREASLGTVPKGYSGTERCRNGKRAGLLNQRSRKSRVGSAPTLSAIVWSANPSWEGTSLEASGSPLNRGLEIEPSALRQIGRVCTRGKSSRLESECTYGYCRFDSGLFRQDYLVQEGWPSGKALVLKTSDVSEIPAYSGSIPLPSSTSRAPHRPYFLKAVKMSVIEAEPRLMR